MPYTVIRAGDRSRTTTAWLTSHHCFSFGDHYDPSNTHHGALIASNEEFLSPNSGFASHRHQESEIVTWVSAGTLVHRDSAGNSGVVYPGLAQRMSAGSGVDHSERNEQWPGLAGSGTHTTHYVQMWILPDQHAMAPSYAQRDVSADLAAGGLVAIASGHPDRPAAISIANSGATLYAARPSAGGALTVPAARYTHVFVVAGALTAVGDSSTDDIRLTAGDAARGRDTTTLTLRAIEPAEVLIWVMDRGLGEF